MTEQDERCSAHSLLLRQLYSSLVFMPARELAGIFLAGMRTISEIESCCKFSCTCSCGVGEGQANSLLNNPDSDGTARDDPEMAAIKARAKEMEEETEKLKQLQREVDKQMSMASPPGATMNLSYEEKIEVDNRSIYVGNVDYGATAEELEQHFPGCGSINRVTIMCNKFDGHPKGFAYIEFAEKDSVQMAMAMDESLFKGRQIKVMPKRTNRPGISSTHRAPRGLRGASAFRGSRGSSRGFYGGYKPRPTRPTRSYRRGGFFTPY